MSLKIKCPDCGKVLEVPDSLRGKRGKCPACAGLVSIPRATGGGNRPTTPPAQKASIKQKCPGCGQAFQIPDSMAGKRVKCPACANVWQVPGSVIVAETVPQSSKLDEEWFDDAMSDEYPIAKKEPEPVSPPMPSFPTSSFSSIASEEPRDSDNGFFAPEMKGLSMGVLGGLLMMAIAVVWFVAGYHAGYIFYYPPILFVIGLFGFLKGLFTGNLAG